MRAFLVALQFLTCLPVRMDGELHPQDTSRSLAWYPVVGLLIGVLLMLSALLLHDSPPLLSAALLLTLWVVLSGALHLDGLADSADAWVGGLGDRDRTLTIMKDPRCGPAGVVTVVLVLLVKFSALFTLLETGNVVLLLLAPALGRMALPLLFSTTPYVREQGLGSALAARPPRGLILLIGAAVFIVLLLVAGGSVPGALVVMVSLFLLLRIVMMRRLGGTTGDVAGALVEMTEVAVLIFLASVC